MSRIGKNPVAVPDSVTPEISGQMVKVKGPKGELSFKVHDDVSVKLEDGQIVLAPKSKSPFARQVWPTCRTRVQNLVTGVTEGYKKDLEIRGVGYRANMQGRTLVLSLGYSHEVNYEVPEGIEVAVEKQTALTITGIDKQKVGQVAAEIRSFRTPEPYKGKGVRYADEYIMMKEGKKK